MKPVLILDFDSTIIQGETLDILAERSLRSLPDGAERLATISRLTEEGMAGTIPFGESLARRVALLSISQDAIEPTSLYLSSLLEPTFEAVFSQLQSLTSHIFVVSGGFSECIVPVLSKFGIEEHHVFANSFVFDASGTIAGINTTLPLSQTGGKVAVVKHLRSLFPDTPFIAVGDGMTDAEMKLSGVAEYFLAFTGCMRRQAVVNVADAEVISFHEIASFCSKVYSP